MQKTPEQIAALIEEIKEARRTKERAKSTDTKTVSYKISSGQKYLPQHFAAA